MPVREEQMKFIQDTHKRIFRGALSALVLGFSQQICAENEKLDIHIDNQTVGPALLALSQYFGVQVVVSKDVANNFHVKTVKGLYTVSEALSIMLEGAGLDYEFISDDSIVIKPQAVSVSETVEEELIEEIVSTGSRFSKSHSEFSATQRNEFLQPAPIIQVNADDLGRAATPDLGSILAELPAVGATATLAGNAAEVIPNAFAGISSADLRRLGEARTLVLVNGKRHVASVGGSAQVDLFSIPLAMVERVELVTGGASAIYGSDAVSGVINVILRDNFDGVALNLDSAGSTEGVGSSNQSASVVFGNNFAEHNGNITVFAGYDRIGAITSNDIRQFDNFSNVANPLDGGEEDGIPDRLLVPRVFSELINNTSTLLDPTTLDVITTFNPDGTPTPQQVRELSNNFVFGSFPNGCDTCLVLENSESYLPNVEKISVGSTLHYDVSDNVTAYGSFRYVDTDTIQLSQSDFTFADYTINVAENAYLDDSLRQTLLDNGLSSVFFARIFEDFGLRDARNNRQLLRYTAGLKGEFTLGETNFDYDLYHVSSESKNSLGTPNVAIVGNLEAALDSVIDPATGLPACRNQVASAQGSGYIDPATVAPDNCAPYNPFGFGQFSGEARNFITAFPVTTEEIEQRVLGATFITDTEAFLELSGGPIDIAFGYEYRKEESSTVFDELTQAGVFAGGAIPNASGGYTVNEYFVELSLPLLTDVPLVQNLSIDAAYRNADYSHAGSVDAWKVGLLYVPFENILLRGTVDEAVRAPNISEAFSPVATGFVRLTDPCDADRIGDDPDRITNCAALGVPTGFEANDAVSILIESSGNPNLLPERSKSYTAGIVWAPDILGDFSLSVDYYNIKIADAIILVTAQNIVDNCVDATNGPDSVFCSAIDRDMSTFDVTLVRSSFLNTAALTTQGIDLAADYRGITLDSLSLPGELRVRFFANRLLELEGFEFQTRPDAVNIENGEMGDPEAQYALSVAYQLNDLSVNWSSRYTDRSANFRVGEDIPEDLSPAFIPTIITHDLSSTYRLDENITITGGVRNLTDKIPPGFVNDRLYDLVGRRAFLSVRAVF